MYYSKHGSPSLNLIDYYITANKQQLQFSFFPATCVISTDYDYVIYIVITLVAS